MFRFALQVAFIRRVLRLRIVRWAIVLVLLGSVVAGAICTYVIFQAVTQRSHSPYVHTHSPH
jgi:hypothetical protein